MKILIAESVVAGKELFSSLGDISIVADERITRDKLVDQDILITRSSLKVNADLLQGTAIKIVGTATSGVEHVDRQYLAEHNIQFYSGHGANAISVAEYVIAALLQLVEQGKLQLSDKTLGIVGYGAVGQQLAKRAALLGLKLLICDPPLQESQRHKFDVGDMVSLSELLAQADIISLHPNLHHQPAWPSYHLASTRFFQQMKKGATFINTSRGAVVDSDALQAAIAAGKLGAVVLDVWEQEPHYSNTLLPMVDIATPHIAGYSYPARIKGTYQVYMAICEQLGVIPEPSWEPLALKVDNIIELDNSALNQQQVLAQIMAVVCGLQQDDQLFRASSQASPQQRADNFKRLRLNYKIRWECSNFSVKLSLADDGLVALLSELGVGMIP